MDEPRTKDVVAVNFPAALLILRFWRGLQTRPAIRVPAERGLEAFRQRHRCVKPRANVFFSGAVSGRVPRAAAPDQHDAHRRQPRCLDFESDNFVGTI